MGFVKVVKNRAYYKRFQVKFRRRREAKTDYYARQRLIIQDKNKYKSPKHRFVVRVTNRDIVCQIVEADLTHDRVVGSAYAHELTRYGLRVPTSNYAAAYATGLLLARRINSKYKLNFEGVTDADGEDFLVEAESDESRSPFRAFLDVGLARTTTGAKIFGALKGAVDGGLDIPHNNKRFPGSARDEDSGDYEYAPDVHRKYIFGGHVADYMKTLKKENEEDFKRQFSQYIAAGVSPDDLEAMWKKIHAAIRADPNKKRGSDERGNFKKRTQARKSEYVNKRYGRPKKVSLQQRKARIKQKLEARGVVSIGPR
eukprot:CAMPEP_0183352646 /NCGR_PEP_ID=MMETSP0164_2-20130417/29569_1 /TAXON_ID=221442 /ORGANISM="Coccolithus pelagicus ssp braarudi, Strain PLY182g" /LENGTH=312 /DNA_ID=CAMNT_0025525127 /DNA_START=10 /DNA_END=948 /DNA_ORIENTATION=-